MRRYLTYVVVAVCLALPGSALAATPGNFEPAQHYEVGGNPEDVAIGDFDRDGDNDVVATHVDPGPCTDGCRGGIVIREGDGTGSLGAPTRYLKDGTWGTAATADFNEDGAEDVVATGYYTIGLLLSNAVGGMTASELVPGLHPWGVEVGDFDGDANMDFTAAAYFGGGVLVFYGNGDGTFTKTSVTADGGGQLAVGDVNGDGFDDVVKGSSGADYSGVATHLSNGTARTFAPGLVDKRYDRATFFALGDVDGDGDLDLATATAAGQTLALGADDGTFTAPTVTPTPYNDVHLAAVNGDARADLVAAGASLVDVRFGQAGGSLGAPASYATNNAPNRVDLGDLDGDGFADLVVANRNSWANPLNSMSVLLNEGADPPTCQSGSVNPYYQTGVTFSLGCTDPAGRDYRLEIVTPPDPAKGSVGEIDQVNDRVSFQPQYGATGPVTFTFRAVDGRRVSDPATITLNIQEPPPFDEQVTVTSPTYDKLYRDEPRPTFTGTAGSAAGDAAQVRLDILIYDGALRDFVYHSSFTATRSGGTWSQQVPGDLPAGTFDLQARQNDASGNPHFSSRMRFRIDPTALVTIDDPTWNKLYTQPTPTFSGQAGDGGGYQQEVDLRLYRWTGTTFEEIVGAGTELDQEGGRWSGSLDGYPLADGSYELQACQWNGTNTGCSSRVRFRVQNAAAVTVTNPRPDQLYTGGSPTFRGTAADSSVYASGIAVRLFRWTGSEFVLDRSTSVLRSGTSWDASFPAELPDGTYELEACQDGGTPRCSSRVRFRIARPVPPPPPVADDMVRISAPTRDQVFSVAAPTFSGVAGQASGDESRVQVVVFRWTGSSFVEQQSFYVNRSGGSWQGTPAALANGTYELEARQNDGRGAVHFSSRVPFRVAVPPPPPPPPPIVAPPTADDAQAAAGALPGSVPAAGLIGDGGIVTEVTMGAPGVVVNQGSGVIAAGGGNVIAAGGGNVIAAGGGNVIAAGGGNVIAAGGGNVIAPGALNRTAGASAAARCPKPTAPRVPKRCPRQALLAVGGHTFPQAGKAQIKVKLTAAGKKAVKKYLAQAKRLRKQRRKVKPLKISLTTIVGPLTPGSAPAVYVTRKLQIKG